VGIRLALILKSRHNLKAAKSGSISQPDRIVASSLTALRGNSDRGIER
jgi:hypothetical protein